MLQLIVRNDANQYIGLDDLLKYSFGTIFEYRDANAPNAITGEYGMIVMGDTDRKLLLRMRHGSHPVVTSPNDNHGRVFLISDEGFEITLKQGKI